MGKGDVQQATVRFFTEEGEEEMAKEKKNYEEILQFFFEGTTLNKEFDEKEATEN